MFLTLLALATQAAPTVTGASPAPGGWQTSPASVTITLSADVDPATVSSSTVSLVGRGVDGSFGTPDDVVVTPTSLSVSANVITLDLSSQVLPDDVYRLRLSGTPSTPAAHSGLFGYWKLSEGIGTQASDSSANGRHGTLDGGAAWAPGLFGSALSLTGGGTQVDIDAGVIMPNWTVSLWVCMTGQVSGTAATVVDSNSEFGTSLQLEQIATGDDVGITEYTVVNYGFGYFMPLSTWVHLTFSSDASNAKLYVNGSLFNTAPREFNLHVDKLGTARTTVTNSPFCVLNEVQVYSRLLTQAEITSLATLTGCIRSTQGVVLNGEYSGAFPSGSGSPGGDFVSTFTVSSLPPPPTPPRVINLIPAPGSLLTTVPTSVIVALDQPIDPSTVTSETVRLIRGGPDGLLGTADDVSVVPASVSISGGSQITLDLAGLPLPNGPYRVSLPGTASGAPPAAGHWTLDEAAGPTAADSSGNGNSGVHMNAPAVIAGKIGNALTLNGVDETVEVADADLLSPHAGPTGQMTLSAWVRLASLPTGGLRGAVVAKGLGSDWEYALSGGTLRLESFNNTNQVGVAIYTVADYPSSYAAPIGQWVHLTFSGTPSQTLLHVNGEFVQALAATFSAPRYFLGSHGYNTLLGRADDVQVFDRNLLADEIRSVASLGGSVRDSNQNRLDGEFGGAFPSGNGSAGGNFSATFGINFPPPAPGTFSAIAPANGATGVPVNPTYSWTASSYAAGYTLQVSTEPGFGVLVVNQAGLTGTSTTPAAALAPGTLHYWRVTATNVSGATPIAGTPLSFTTAGTAPGSTPTSSVKAKGCGLLGIELVAVWLLRRRRRPVKTG